MSTGAPCLPVAPLQTTRRESYLIMTVWLFPWKQLGSSGNGDRHGQSLQKPAANRRVRNARVAHVVPLLHVSPLGSNLRSVSDLAGLIGNPHDFYRASGVARNAFRNAAKQETLHAFSPVGTLNDEICT